MLKPLITTLALLCGLAGQALAAGQASGGEVEFLDAEQAYPLRVTARGDQAVSVSFQVAPGYYLYRDKISFSADNGVTLGTPQFPAAEEKTDPYFGKQRVYHAPVTITVPISSGKPPFTLTAVAQGCADAGLCYPPLTQTAAITGSAAANPAAATDNTGSASGDDSDRIAGMLQGQNLLLVLASFFGFGLLLAFTPCVFPMIPILSGIIVGRGRDISKLQALKLSLCYVLGMAVTYTAAGVAAGLSGTLLSAALQNAWVLGGFALVFVALSLSMFGVYQLQLPAALQSRLSDKANASGGSLLGVSLMGALSALIVGPCVAAPLAGALLYIAKTGDAVLGGAALFMMALGMGAPLVLVGVASRAALPKAGGWMEGVKQVFGVLLLGVALWLVSPVLPMAALMLLLAALLLFCGIFLHALEPLPAGASAWRRLQKGSGLIGVIVGGALLIGVLAGSRDPLQPLAVLNPQATAATTAQPAAGATRFEKVKTVAELDARLAAADRPVMLDFYADWCVSCKEMEHLTFSDPQVKARMDKMILLKADVTANNADDKALLKRFGLFGPPGIMLFAPGSAEVKHKVIGFVPAKDFAPRLDRVL